MLDDPEIEHSPLSGNVERDGVEVRVEIYRIRHEDDGWSLEVVDHEGASTVWTDTFKSDHDAYRAFCLTVEKEGIRTFLDGSAHQLH